MFRSLNKPDFLYEQSKAMPMKSEKKLTHIIFLISSFENRSITAFLTHRSYATSLWRTELATAKGTQSLARSYNYAVA